MDGRRSAAGEFLPTLMAYYARDLILVLSGDRTRDRIDLVGLAEHLLDAL